MIENQTEDHLLSRYSTFKIGGIAKRLLLCNSTEDIQRTIYPSKQNELSWVIVGNGSNILFGDEGFPGLVIKLGKNFKNAIFHEKTVEVGAGVLLPTLSRHFLAKGWGGFEFMCGIPGTIGGAVRMNAGTRQGEIKNHFVSADVLSPSGEMCSISLEEMKFGHRTSCLASTRDIVLSVKFRCPYLDSRAHIKEKIKQIITERRKKQPKIKRNCGSVFKRPLGGKPAGWYIDQAGLKGLRVGGAMVAHEHANWIVNLGDAKAADVKQLIQRVQKEVFEQFGVLLEREVIYIPEDIVGVEYG